MKDTVFIKQIIEKLRNSTPNTIGMAAIYWDGETYNSKLTGTEIALLISLLESQPIEECKKEDSTLKHLDSAIKNCIDTSKLE